MPAYRNIGVSESSRRSRRLSEQKPRNYAEDKCEGRGALSTDRELVNPVSRPTPLISTSSSGSSSESSSLMCSEPRRASHSRPQPGHIPRPPNAFFLFRSDFWAREKLKKHPIERNHRSISRIVSYCWKSLGSEERARYQALAEQRKQLHQLEHPNYKYAPANSLGKAEKKKPKKEFNKGDEEEKERCRKVAALVMDGLSSSDIQEAMKVNKQPISYSKARQPTPSSYRRAFNTSLPAVPSNARVAGNWQLDLSHEKPTDTFLNEEFVPIDEIPHLDLSAPKDEQAPTPDFDTSIRPLGYDAIDSQFGFRPAVSQGTADTCFWYPPDRGVSPDENIAFPPFSENLIVELKNPFEFMIATDWNATFDQDSDDMVALAAYGTNTKMNQYLHFDC